MAGAAALVVGRGSFLERLMRLMAGEAGELALALGEALALAEVNRLVPDIPGVIPVDGFALYAGRPVAASAEFVERCGRKPPGIADSLAGLGELAAGRSGGMIAARPVAAFALDSRFEGLQSGLRIESHGSGGVALEAPEDSRLRV